MKRIINVLLALVLIIVSAISLVACDGQNGDGAKTGLLLKKYSGEDFYTVYGYVDEGKGVTSLDIATIAGEKTVGRIAKTAFNGNDTLKEVIVPSTVTEIEANAFSKMKALEKITLPFVGKTANADSFMHQTGEATDKSVDKERIFAFIFGEEEYAYGEKITVKYGTGEATYYLPSTLTEVTIAPAGEYNIPMYAFCGTAQIGKVNLVGNITEIGEHAFENCRDLNSVNIPASVKTIYAYAFNNCEYLNTGLKFDENSTLKTLKDYAFANSKVANFILPASVETIGDYCFADSNIVTFKFPASLKSIGNYAFYNNKYLTTMDVSSLILPPQDVEVGVSAFEKCDNIQD